MTRVVRRGGGRARRALTLLEILVSIAIAILLLAAMFAFLWDVLATRRRLIEDTARVRTAAMLVEEVERDLMTSIVGGGDVGPGLRGDETSLAIVRRAVPVGRLPAGDPAAALADLERSEYRFAGGALRVRRTAVLAPAAGASEGDGPSTSRAGDDDDAAPAPPVSLRAALGTVRFRFHDGSGWRASFDSMAAGRLPLAVEVTVWLTEDEAGASGDGSGTGPAEAPAGYERETFDAGAGFDEMAALEALEAEERPRPMPDRVRVIFLPDGAAAAEEAAP